LLVFVLLASGTLSGFVEVDAVRRLTETRYGWTLLAKLALIVPLLGVAAYNARWGRRAVEAGNSGAERRLVRTSLLEAGLGAAVFVAAAMLTQTTATKSIVDMPESRPFEASMQVSGLNVDLNVDPNRTGLNSYRVQLTDASGAPVDAERVRLTFRYRRPTKGPSNLTPAGGRAALHAVARSSPAPVACRGRIRRKRRRRGRLLRRAARGDAGQHPQAGRRLG
jgi:copper transport protein